MGGKKKDHLSESGVYKGVLTRNSTYKKDARGKLVGQQIYGTGKYATVLAAIKKRDAAQGRPDGRFKKSRKLIKGKTQEQRAQTFPITYKDNFKAYFSCEPYPHQAHHVLPCQAFYDEEKWDIKHLNVLMKVKYDINNADNIIYLPQGEDGNWYLCDYHNLPNHAKNHPAYNERLVLEVQPVWSIINEVVEEKICPIPDATLEKILKKLQQIESSNFDSLKSAGAVQMPG